MQPPLEQHQACPDVSAAVEELSASDDDDESQSHESNGNQVELAQEPQVCPAGEPVLDRVDGQGRRKVAVPRGALEFEAYYALQLLCNADDWRRCVERLLTSLPPAFRVKRDTAARETQLLLEALKPWEPEPVGWCPSAYRLLRAGNLGAKGRLEDKRLNKVLVRARRAGLIERQETASMLPALLLQVQAHHRILDLCAAPGSKTMQVLELMHASCDLESAQPPTGLLVANDIKSTRLNRVLGRARRLPAAPLLLTCCDARRYPNLFTVSGRAGKVRFDHILCDVPCSGDGTVRKAKGLLENWTARGGLCHHGDQLAILCRGIQLLESGGVLVYSTCSLNPVENEAVVAAALTWAEDTVEVLQAEVPGLQLMPGLTTWRVPAPAAVEGAAAGGVTYGAWEEVPSDDKGSGRLRRTMFPPAAHARSAEAASAISEQLKRCGRLLPLHDNGGCFFVCLLRRLDADQPLRRGDRVRVLKNGLEATVRGPGTGQFIGLLRVAYAEDGSMYHVSRAGLERWGCAHGRSKGDAEALDGLEAAGAEEEAPNLTDSCPPIVLPVSDEDWGEVARFYGLVSDAVEASRLGVQRFPREALVYGLDPGFDGSGTPGTALCLASEALRQLGRAPNPRPAMRLVFFRPPQPSEEGLAKDPHLAWPSGACPWRPMSEVARLLATCCTHRVARAPSWSILQRLAVEHELEASAVGVNPLWEDGAVIVVADAVGAAQGHAPIAIVGLLSLGRVRIIYQKGFNVLNLLEVE